MDYAYILDELLTGGGLFYILYSMGYSLFGIALYVLQAWGLHAIAKRRGISHTWMSWVPVLNLWVLGCISDQYRYVVKGQNKSKRKTLIALSIILALLYIAMIVLLVIMGINTIGNVAGGMDEYEALEKLLGPAVGILALCLPMAGVAIALTVVRYMAMYDLYTSCNPQNNVVFLVLSIFFQVTEPFFVFFNRLKDDGMPPRRTEEPQQPQYIPPQPAYEPPAEPWENPENE
jgi:hypothetical protein